MKSSSQQKTNGQSYSTFYENKALSYGEFEANTDLDGTLVDPDGEFFWALIAIAAQAAATSAAINAATQLIFTGEIDWGQVGTSALSGGLSGGLSFGIGELGQALGMGNDVMFKTVAHGISGGIQSAAFGGNFGAGFAGGAVGNIGGHFMGDDLVGRTAVGGLAGGAGAWAVGGDFGMGFQAGAYNAMYNYFLHDMSKSMYERLPGQDQAKQAYAEAIERYGLNGIHNGEQDAWRHARWSQLMAASHGKFYSFFSGFAHELKGAMTGQPFNEFRMDMSNNWRGLRSSGPIDVTKLRLNPN